MISKSLKSVLKHARKPMGVNNQRFAGGGGPKKAKMPEDQTDFDVILVGGANASALTKFIQHE